MVGLSNHEKMSEIVVTVAEKKVVLLNLGLNGTLQKRRDTNIENRTEIASPYLLQTGTDYHSKRV